MRSECTPCFRGAITVDGDDSGSCLAWYACAFRVPTKMAASGTLSAIRQRRYRVQVPIIAAGTRGAHRVWGKNRSANAKIRIFFSMKIRYRYHSFRESSNSGNHFYRASQNALFFCSLCTSQDMWAERKKKKQLLLQKNGTLAVPTRARKFKISNILYSNR